jgi:hypothetical protein
MLMTILMAAWLTPAAQISMECANVAAVETQAVAWPGSVKAVLKVSSGDDHSKNSHQCLATFELLVSSGSGEAQVVDLTMSDDDYGRSLMLNLSGITPDGKRILGIISEGEKHPSATLFEYEIGKGPAKLIDLRAQLPVIGAEWCEARFQVMGTTEGGGVVVDVTRDETSEKPCKVVGKWVFEVSGHRPQRLREGMRVVGLYGAGA